MNTLDFFLMVTADLEALPLLCVLLSPPPSSFSSSSPLVRRLLALAVVGVEAEICWEEEEGGGVSVFNGAVSSSG